MLHEHNGLGKYGTVDNTTSSAVLKIEFRKRQYSRYSVHLKKKLKKQQQKKVYVVISTDTDKV